MLVKMVLRSLKLILSDHAGQTLENTISLFGWTAKTGHVDQNEIVGHLGQNHDGARFRQDWCAVTDPRSSYRRPRPLHH